MAVPKHKKEKIMNAGNEMCFEVAAKNWIKTATTRKRKRMRLTSVPTIESALKNYINIHIGKLPLSEVHNGTCKPIVDMMEEKGLSSATQNHYMNVVKAVVKSVRDPRTGFPVYDQRWSSEFLDLVQVEHSKTPTLTATEIEAMLTQSCKGSWEYRFFLVLAATGLRISECLGLEWKHLINDGRTLVVEQQVDRFGVVTPNLKTKSGKREVDLHTAVTAVLLADRPGSGEGLIFSTKNGSPLMRGNVSKRRLKDFTTGGFHAFRRFRNTHIRSVGGLEDLRLYWMGHKPESMGEIYSKLSQDLEKRLQEAEKIGLGFTVIEGCLPRSWRRIICITHDPLKGLKKVS